MSLPSRTGPLVLDTATPGERKRDGIIPLHPAVLRASRRRWALFFATLEPGVWDGTRSVLWQLRDGAPDGPVLREGVVRSCIADWEPLGDGARFSRRCGTPVAFGVPKGACRQGRPLPSANRFVLRWYVLGFPLEEGRAVSPFGGPCARLHPEAKGIAARTLRVEWMQFRLNDAEDDLEATLPPQPMRERGCDDGDAFSSLGAGRSHVLGITAPVASNPEATEWLGFDTFAPWREMHSEVAAVGFRYDPAAGLYEWSRTGPAIRLGDGARIGEACALRLPSGWAAATRDFGVDGRTRWLLFDDPFSKPGRTALAPPDEGPREGPRTAYVCADGVLRLFGNDNAWRTRGRDVLYAWEVDPSSFALSRRRIVFSPREAGLPFSRPFADMAKLCPPEADGQRVAFRCLTHPQVSRHDPSLVPTEEENRVAGIYQAPVELAGAPSPEWEFAG
jgi:hypothetical protein